MNRANSSCSNAVDEARFWRERCRTLEKALEVLGRRASELELARRAACMRTNVTDAGGDGIPQPTWKGKPPAIDGPRRL